MNRTLSFSPHCLWRSSVSPFWAAPTWRWPAIAAPPLLRVLPRPLVPRLLVVVNRLP